METSRLCIGTGPLILFLRGREPVAAAVEKAVQRYDCVVTAVTAYELLFGVARAKREIGEDALLGLFAVIPFDEAAARRAAALHNQLISANLDIGVKDVLIASICLEHSLPLLTLNERHFARVSGLEVVTPDDERIR